MQIDFHHGVTYIAARLAGFEHQPASIIAYSAQYVDDAINDGFIRFDNGALFHRISSAHKMLDYRNFEELANYGVWIPFHFLPGNDGLPANEDPQGSFIDKLICRPNSYVAQEMVKECINRRHTPYGLHRLGITAHVYVDTWAHQGFAGVNHRVNEAKHLLDEHGKPDRNLMDRLQNYFVSEALPLGHGSVLSHPDKPFLRWGYFNGRGEQITRNNPKDFLEAADNMCKVMQRYITGNPDAVVPGLPQPDKTLIAQMLETITDNKGSLRHQKWLSAIAQGKFSFGKANVTYIPKGKDSWKHVALGTENSVDRENERFPYHPSFLASDWKLFHDALQSHHFYIIHDLLPKYGICVA
ncbi:hypothetical protein FNW02_02655 [Komarekiella sp. 'clone 1']|uniref:Uncharacterized protein n=1 Tax=Komarekiella delphini-convector SJRDD-AB1 TaxID=2593771 RepID=A0AA40VP08_9NOST|nr:DUF6765 family protein [Komarekiella delphini-convector]MBD6614787.1 hypothetical protein [Komarekiella delphini-convector SJRDD-AB1]